ncbi:MAG: hypothetical protein QXQ46_09680 [Thermoplasmatales archaeon]
MTKPMGSFEFSHRTVMTNKRILRKRALVEYPFAIMKRIFHFSHTLVAISRSAKHVFLLLLQYFAMNIMKG